MKEGGRSTYSKAARGTLVNPWSHALSRRVSNFSSVRCKVKRTKKENIVDG